MNPTEALSFSRAKIAARAAVWMAVAALLGMGVLGIVGWQKVKSLQSDVVASRTSAWTAEMVSHWNEMDRQLMLRTGVSLEKRVAELERDLACHKIVQDIWDEASFEVETENARKVRALESRVAELDRGLAGAVEGVTRWWKSLQVASVPKAEAVPSTSLYYHDGTWKMTAPASTQTMSYCDVDEVQPTLACRPRSAVCFNSCPRHEVWH